MDVWIRFVMLACVTSSYHVRARHLDLTQKWPDLGVKKTATIFLWRISCFIVPVRSHTNMCALLLPL